MTAPYKEHDPFQIVQHLELEDVPAIPDEPVTNHELLIRIEEVASLVQQVLDIMEGLQKVLGMASQHPMLGAFFGNIGG